MVTQRLPCLLWLHRKGHRGRPGPVVEDVRLVGCGHRYTAALTWRGEVFVWGQLGGKSWRVPTVLEALRRAVVVQLACGQAHLAVVTGDGRALRDDFQRKELERGEAARVQLEKIEQKRAKIKEEARKAQQEANAAKHARRDEKKRVKLLKRQEKKREKLERVGVGKKKVDSDEESEGED